jgi:hypothetical protein
VRIVELLGDLDFLIRGAPLRAHDDHVLGAVALALHESRSPSIRAEQKRDRDDAGAIARNRETRASHDPAAGARSNRPGTMSPAALSPEAA